MWYNNRMSKKLFKELIKRASQPVAKDTGKQPRSDDYNEKRTRPSKAVDTPMCKMISLP